MINNRAALLNDWTEVFRVALGSLQARLWTTMPGIVTKVNAAEMTVEVQPAIQGVIENVDGTTSYVNLPLLIHVPVVFPKAGGFALTFPIAVGDEVLVSWACRCIDAWWQSGDVQLPMEARMHDLSDGFAIPGPTSQPKVLDAISTTDVQLRNQAGNTILSIGADGKIGFQNATTSLKSVLTDLETCLNTFMTTLSGFSGGGAPVTQAMLQAPAATAAAALTPILTKIGALLK